MVIMASSIATFNEKVESLTKCCETFGPNVLSAWSTISLGNVHWSDRSDSRRAGSTHLEAPRNYDFQPWQS